MGIAVVLMDTPLGGLRSVGRYNNGNVGMEVNNYNYINFIILYALL